MIFTLHLTSTLDTPFQGHSIGIEIVNAWFLADMTVCSGTIFQTLRLANISQHYSFEDKLDYLIRRAGNEDGFVDTVVNMRKTYYLSKKVKNKTREMIIAQEKVKRVIEPIFMDLAQKEMDLFAKYGYNKIIDLTGEARTIGYYPAFYEQYERKEPGYYPYSQVFLNTIKEEHWQPDSTYNMRNNWLVYNPEIQEGLKTEFGPDYDTPKPMFLYRVPNLVALEVSELMVLKLRFDSAMEPVREAIAKLANRLKEGTKLPQECLADTENELSETLTSLREQLLNDPLNQYILNADPNQYYTDLYLGVVPHHFNWVLEKLLGSLPSDTLQVLEADRAKETETKPWVPYILMVPKAADGKWQPALTEPEWNPVPKVQEKPMEEPLPSARKTLDI